MVAQALPPELGFHVDLGPMSDWVLEFEEEQDVNSGTETSLAAILAAGDMITYPRREDMRTAVANSFSGVVVRSARFRLGLVRFRTNRQH
jgi:thioredoxin reductase